MSDARDWLGSHATTRIVNCLKRVGIQTPEEAAKAVESGYICRIENMGRSSYNKICAALIEGGHLSRKPQFESTKRDFVPRTRERGTSIYLLESEIDMLIGIAPTTLTAKFEKAKTKLR